MDTERCLHRLHLRDPTPDCLRLVGHTFACVSRLKLTATASPTPTLSPAPSFTLSTLSANISTSTSTSTTGPPSPLPSAPGTPTADSATSSARPLDLDLSQPHAEQLLCGSLSRVGHLGLRSKRPGGCVLCVGHLQVGVEAVVCGGLWCVMAVVCGGLWCYLLRRASRCFVGRAALQHCTPCQVARTRTVGCKCGCDMAGDTGHGRGGVRLCDESSYQFALLTTTALAAAADGPKQVLQPTASALRSLCLRSCAVDSWAGLEVRPKETETSCLSL